MMSEQTQNNVLAAIRVPRELHAKLKALAESERRTIITMVEIMYEQYIESINAHQK
jgi:predicted DNA-binding protein